MWKEARMVEGKEVHSFRYARSADASPSRRRLSYQGRSRGQVGDKGATCARFSVAGREFRELSARSRRVGW